MPYIIQRRREKLDKYIDTLAAAILQMCEADITASDGDLNYTITRLLHTVYDLQQNPRYHKINSAVGILECVKQELYRRIAAPYEDVKIKENGDV